MKKPVVFLFLTLFALSLRTKAQDKNIDALVKYVNSAKIRAVKFKNATRVSDSLSDNQHFNTGYKFLMALHKQYDKLPADSFTPDLHNITGNFYVVAANYTQALDEFVLSDEQYKQQRRPKGRCSAVTNMGNCYYYLENYDKALFYYKQALDINDKEVHDEEISSNIYNNIGILYSLRKNYKMGLNFFSKALYVYMKTGDSLSIGQAYNNFATLLLEQDKKDSAFYFFKLAMGLKLRSGSKSDIIDSYNNMASIYFKMNDDRNALVYLHKNLVLLDTSIYTPDLKQTYRLFYEIYQKQKNDALAFKYYKLSRTIGDSIDAHNETGELIRKEASMQVSKAHLADSLSMAEENKIRDLELVQRKKENTFLIISLSVAGLIALLLYNRFRVTHRQKLLIDEQKSIMEEKQKEILDSIHYAKRIQQSLLTSETYIARILNKKLK